MEEEIMECFIKGETVEQILKKYPRYTEEEIRKVYKQKERDILMLRLVPAREIAEKFNIDVTNIYKIAKIHKYKGRILREIVHEKQENSEKLVKEGKTAKEIAELLHIDIKVAEDLQDIKIIDGSIKQEMLDEFIKGKTVEQVKEKYPEFTEERIRKIYQRRRQDILILRLIPTKEIAERFDITVENVYRVAREHRYRGKTLREIVETKREKIRELLKQGKDAEEIAKKLHVDIKSVENEQGINILDRFIEGMTINQVKEKYPEYSEEKIREVYKKREQDILILRLVPTKEIAERFNISLSVVNRKIRNHTYNGMTLKKIIKEKEEKLNQLVKEGVDKREIAKKLHVDISVVEEKLKKDFIELVDGTIDGQILDEIINGRTIEEIKEKYPEYGEEKVREIYKKREQDILILRLFPAREIADKLNINISNIYVKKKMHKYKGKTLKEVVEEKENSLNNLLERGIDTKVIADGLQIDLDIVEKTKKAKKTKDDNNLQKTKKRKTKKNNKKKNTDKSSQMQSKIELHRTKEKELLIIQLRNNYKKLMKQGNEKDEKEKKLVDIKIKQLQAQINRKKAQNILEAQKLVSELSETQITLKQLDEIRQIVSKIPREPNTAAKRKIRKLERYMVGKALEIAIKDTNDIEELKKIMKQINNIGDNFQKNILQYKGREKLAALKRQGDYTNIMYKKIAQGITQGNIKIEKARDIIERKAKERVQKGPKNKFALTEEQQRRQILLKIASYITNNSKEFPIKDTDTTLMLGMELLEKSKIDSINMVITNLLERGEIKQAEDLCKNYEVNLENEEERRKMGTIKKEVERVKLGKEIVKLLEGETSKKESRMLVNKLYQIKEEKDYNLTSILLGKKKDKKRITLQDIWITNDLEKGTQK